MGRHISASRASLTAVVFGAGVGGVVYPLLLPDWFPALAVGAIMPAVRTSTSRSTRLLGTHIEFTGGTNRAGYAVGLFGVSIGPLAPGEFTGVSPAAIAGIVLWQLGMLGFLFLSAAATRREP